MAAWRSSWRLGVLLAATLGWFLVFLFCFLVWPTGTRRRHLRDWVTHRWARVVLRTLSVRLSVRGTPPVGGALLVANHLSYFDIPVLAAIRPLSFLAKSEVARWPVLGLLLRVVGVQFVVRDNLRSLPAVADRLLGEVAAGHAVLFFPEGTSSSGERVLPFRPALLEPAAVKALPVYYASLRYTTPAAGPPASTAVCWWGDMTFAPHVLALLRLPWIEAEVSFGADPVQSTDRKELAIRLHARVEAALAARDQAHRTP